MSASSAFKPSSNGRPDVHILNEAEQLFLDGELWQAFGKLKGYLKLYPDDGDVAYNCGVLSAALNDSTKTFLEASGYFDRALCAASSSQETKSDAMNYMGILMEKVGRTDKAAIAFHFALQINPNNTAARKNFGDCKRAEGLFEEADAEYRRVLELDPNQAEAHLSRGMVQLLMGNFKEGWHNYEHRWDDPGFPSKRFESYKPIWQGEDLRGKTILLTAEQGFGDVFQFIRYAEHINSMGARVWFIGDASLEGCISLAKGVDKVLSVWADDDEPWDYHCPVLSLPHRLGTFKERLIPKNIPYFDLSHAELFPHFPDREEDAPRVGLIWAGSPRHGKDSMRSIAPEMFKMLVDQFAGEASFFSFQCGPKAREVAKLKPFVDPFPANQIRTWEDTLVALNELDMLVSVDTGCVHLAGAIGLPTLMLCPHSPDWRWMLARSDSPWYPGLRILRQPAAGDWFSVFIELREVLGQWIRSYNLSRQ